jgi:hypothetical protein
VTLVSNNEDALRELTEGQPYDVLIEDIKRPPGELLDAEACEHGWRTGLVFFERLVRPRFPDLPHVFLSGFPPRPEHRHYSDDTNCFFLPKPLRLSYLADFIRTVYERRLETLYVHDEREVQVMETRPLVVPVHQEVKRYLDRHPERLCNMSLRPFEELVADILADLGFECELSNATHDGGIDIYAYIRHKVARFLMLVECRGSRPSQCVGTEVVERVYGIRQTAQPGKRLIVTAPFFSLPAREEASRHDGLHGSLMDRTDYEVLNRWLARCR